MPRGSHPKNTLNEWGFQVPGIIRITNSLLPLSATSWLQEAIRTGTLADHPVETSAGALKHENLPQLLGNGRGCFLTRKL